MMYDYVCCNRNKDYLTYRDFTGRDRSRINLGVLIDRIDQMGFLSRLHRIIGMHPHLSV
jgi:hypothetical protein